MDKDALVALLNTLDAWLIFFGLFVAIGVVGESVVGFLHWRRSGELQQLQTSENLAQQLEIERLRARMAPRFLSAEQISSLSLMLAVSKVKYLGLYVVGQDPDTMRIANQIGEGLQVAHWTFLSWSVLSAALSGIEVTYREGSNQEIIDAAQLLVSSLASVGLVVTLDKPFPKDSNLGLINGPLWTQQNGGEIRLLVGTKP